VRQILLTKVNRPGFMSSLRAQMIVETTTRAVAGFYFGTGFYGFRYAG